MMRKKIGVKKREYTSDGKVEEKRKRIENGRKKKKTFSKKRTLSNMLGSSNASRALSAKCFRNKVVLVLLR